MDHSWIFAEARAGVTLDSLNKFCRGLWSDSIVISLPYKYWWNLFTPKTTASPSFSNWEYFFSAGVRVWDEKVIGLSSPSSLQWDRTAPIPYGQALKLKL